MQDVHEISPNDAGWSGIFPVFTFEKTTEVFHSSGTTLYAKRCRSIPGAMEEI